ncbi:type II restriction enzyme [Snodgrassella alvi]|uniref:type II restriction enzyme n=1 Tax=Snodgrassella alvi TaxID=1196083 RepID=UPI00242A5A1C|nr:hypothetical protein [Snodgrassella alvi]MCT6883605.1 hypothetical protein [Snodgrassella alvi]WLT02679.1 hypothetical protein RAM00_02245 [Snodgrassella alvi]
MDNSKDLCINGAWELLFEKYNILERVDDHGFFEIDAKQIKEIKEPRLMAKFDHSVNLPIIFFENHLAILPITRGRYVIGNFQAYQNLQQINADSPIKRRTLPDYIESLDLSAITSEAIALNCAYASGIIADFLNENELNPTVAGRLGSGAFDFFIKLNKLRKFYPILNKRICVNKSQIEIDAGYEGLHSLALIEAKLDISEDFLIRQIYYPYRVWKKRIQKPVRSIFFIYSNGIYNLYEYEFTDLKNYNSLIQIRHSRYAIEDTKIRMADIERVLQETVVLDDNSEIPFPQADKFERVINLCELLVTKELSCREITEHYAFDKRQADYYANSARYLGLVDKKEEENNTYYLLTKDGRRILGLGYQDRQLEFCKLILQHRIFNSVLKEYIKNKNIPVQKSKIIEIMREANLYPSYSDVTISRRSSTVRKWIEWILDLVK